MLLLIAVYTRNQIPEEIRTQLSDFHDNLMSKSKCASGEEEGGGGGEDAASDSGVSSASDG